MKKIFKLLTIFVVAMVLVACGAANNTPNNNAGNNNNNAGGNNNNDNAGNDLGIDDNSLYLITDVGTIDDKSFNQGSWEGMAQYAEEVNVKANYLQPAEQSDTAYLTEIDTAIAQGAKVIVTPGFLFANVILQAQDTYPDVKFILVDSTPNNGSPDPETYVEKIGENTLSILYREEQAGFLAGYASVVEGYTELGFMGGMAVPAVVRFGYGFAAGADYAAQELDVDVNLKYTYLDSFLPDPAHATMASAWYQGGTEVIHAAAGGAGNSVMASAEQADKWMVGVDVDQKEESPKVLTSAMKNLKGSVYEATKAAVEGGFAGGTALNLGVNDDGVQISDDFSRFETFTQEDYDAVYALLVADTDGIASNIPTLETTDDVTTLEFERVTIESLE